MQKQIIKGKIENIFFNTLDEEHYISINITISKKNVLILPTYQYIEPAIVPQFVLDRKPYIFELEVISRFNCYYVYDKDFWKSIRKVEVKKK